MRFKASVSIGLIAIVAVAAAGGVWLVRRNANSSFQDTTVVATPAGITIQGISPPGRPSKFFRQSDANRGLAYASAKGMTLYTYDKDVESGKSSCTGDCAKAWPAAIASANAKAFGDWSIVGRDDGTKQWAYKGKPLYAFSKDAGIGDNKGDNAAGGVWHIAYFRPTSDLKLPYGIAIQDVADANALALVDDRGMTLYAFDGDAQRDDRACSISPCTRRWLPVSAPQLANPIGAFSIAKRADGSNQWAFKGKPLYRFADDLQPGDVTGNGIDKKWHTAVVVNYFMPSEANIQLTPGHGAVLATAGGMTLYRRDTSFHFPSGHGLQHSVPGISAWGRLTGTKGCNAECLKVWHPFKAAEGSEPSGFWDILTRSDGTRQWAYKGYALYTYAGDKKPGDTTGTDIYDILVPDDLHEAVYDEGVVPTTSAAILYWAYAEP